MGLHGAGQGAARGAVSGRSGCRLANKEIFFSVKQGQAAPLGKGDCPALVSDEGSQIILPIPGQKGCLQAGIFQIAMERKGRALRLLAQKGMEEALGTNDFIMEPLVGILLLNSAHAVKGGGKEQNQHDPEGKKQRQLDTLYIFPHSGHIISDESSPIGQGQGALKGKAWVPLQGQSAAPSVTINLKSPTFCQGQSMP
ncbi:hypothetical protein ACUUL3_06795 [Thiovibrio sp. JS02]